MKIVVKEAIINKQCKMLKLGCNKITSTGASIIAEALNNNTSLEVLCFRDNRLCDKGVHVIAKTLSLNNSKIDLLSLQNIGITDEGAEYISEMFKRNTTLAYLLISYNQISDRGIELLANVLTLHNTTLKSLRVEENKLVSDSSVGALAKMLKHNQILKWLVLDGCNLSEKGKERLRQIAQSKKGFQLSV
jgi:Ran GTPase-activating protein (RanGAP) involved in mRNA processing and transport